MTTKPALTILYDGNCPLCIRQVAFLRKHDQHRRLQFTDIRAPGFMPPTPTVSMQLLERRIHAVLPDATLIDRMDVIRAAYSAIGRGWLMAPTGWPLLKPLFDKLYDGVAKNRLTLSRLFGKNSPAGR